MEEKYCDMFPTRLKINTKCVSVENGRVYKEWNEGENLLHVNIETRNQQYN